MNTNFDHDIMILKELKEQLNSEHDYSIETFNTDMFQIRNEKGQYYSKEGEWSHLKYRRSCILNNWEKEIAVKFFKENNIKIKCKKCKQISLAKFVANQFQLDRVERWALVTIASIFIYLILSQ